MKVNVIYSQVTVRVEQTEKEFNAVYNAIEHYLNTVDPCHPLLLSAKEEYMKGISFLAKYHSLIKSDD